MGGFGTGLWGGGGLTGAIPVTGNSLVYGALRLLGVLRPGSSAATASNDDGLAWLNELLDSWATERLMVQAIGRGAAIATNGSAVYYAASPHRIEGAGYVALGGTAERPLRVYGPEEWRGVGRKILAGEPAALYPEYGASEATLYPWPQPASGDLYVYQWQPLTVFADLATEYVLPPGYALALRYCLAAQIAPAFAIITKIPQPHLGSIEAKAHEYKGRIKSRNCAAQLMVCDAPGASGGRRMDIFSGEWL
jgi:hypothetical protein